MDPKNCQLLESNINRLLVRLSKVLREGEKAEVAQFVDAGEYGVALETLCGILVEEGYTVSHSVLHEIKDLGSTMKVAPEFWRQIRTDAGG